MSFFANAIELREVFIRETLTTLYMVLSTSIIAGFLGLLLGIALMCTEPGHLFEHARLHFFLDKVVNMFRSMPFIILLALVAPLTRLLVGTSIGSTAAIVPLTLGAAPFFARQVHHVLHRLDLGVIEAAHAMGLSKLDILRSVYLRESREGLVRAGVLTMISIVGLSAMAGAIGAGGLGHVAIAYGYNRFCPDVTLVATLLIFGIVFCIEALGKLALRALETK